jgi:hypothetical protein
MPALAQMDRAIEPRSAGGTPSVGGPHVDAAARHTSKSRNQIRWLQASPHKHSRFFLSAGPDAVPAMRPRRRGGRCDKTTKTAPWAAQRCGCAPAGCQPLHVPVVVLAMQTKVGISVTPAVRSLQAPPDRPPFHLPRQTCSCTTWSPRPPAPMPLQAATPGPPSPPTWPAAPPQPLRWTAARLNLEAARESSARTRRAAAATL